MSISIPAWVHATKGEEDRASRLATRLNLPVSEEPIQNIQLVIAQLPGGALSIGFTEQVIRGGSIDLGSPAWFAPDLTPRYRAGGRDPLMRAIGFKTMRVVDCTAGWGVDAVHIAHHGIAVDAVERHPVVAAMLRSAWQTAASQHESTRLQFHCGDAAAFIERLDDRPEVVYLDPMYPPKPGSAAARRPLQLLQALHAHSEDDDSAVLLHIARRRAKRRVVVKRPHHAPSLAPGASGSINGKLVRFDLYSPLTPTLP